MDTPFERITLEDPSQTQRCEFLMSLGGESVEVIQKRLHDLDGGWKECDRCTLSEEKARALYLELRNQSYKFI